MFCVAFATFGPKNDFFLLPGATCEHTASYPGEMCPMSQKIAETELQLDEAACKQKCVHSSQCLFVTHQNIYGGTACYLFSSCSKLSIEKCNTCNTFKCKAGECLYIPFCEWYIKFIRSTVNLPGMLVCAHRIRNAKRKRPCVNNAVLRKITL